MLPVALEIIGSKIIEPSAAAAPAAKALREITGVCLDVFALCVVFVVYKVSLVSILVF